MALPLPPQTLAHTVWRTEEQAFVAGGPWVELGFAQAVIHPEIPEVWDASFVGRVAATANPRRLYEEARRLLRRAGCGHVKIVIEDPMLFGTTGMALRRLGLGERAYVTMAIDHLPPPRRGAGVLDVTPVGDARSRRVMAEVRDAVRREAPWYAPEVSGALDAWEDLQADRLDLVWLVARLDGVPAGAVGLMVTRDGASLQSLATVPGLRRRGVATALIREVVQRGLARGAPRVSLLADRDDSPRALYRKLGFGEVGEIREYLRALT